MVTSDLGPAGQAYVHWFEHTDHRSWAIHPRTAFEAGWYAAMDRLHAEATGLGAGDDVLSLLEDLRHDVFNQNVDR